jgi:23S rRNA-/tRNA-specific pseudouridylate synthase
VNLPEVIHRDRDLLVLFKPPGLATTAPSADQDCLVRWVGEAFPGLRAHPTSRLDSPVSGVVTFALNKGANQQLLQARRSGRYERLYVGLTLHRLDEPSGQWSWPISVDPGSKKRRQAGSGVGEREARTRYEVAARTPQASLLQMRPETGRTHQLRVHAAKAGAPLFGDHGYGGERRHALPNGTVITARRVMLHCARVGFPWNGAMRRFEASVPDDMIRIWTALGGQSPMPIPPG